MASVASGSRQTPDHASSASHNLWGPLEQEALEQIKGRPRPIADLKKGLRHDCSKTDKLPNRKPSKVVPDLDLFMGDMTISRIKLNSIETSLKATQKYYCLFFQCSYSLNLKR